MVITFEHNDKPQLGSSLTFIVLITAKHYEMFQNVWTTLLSILLWQEWHLFREHLIIMFCVYCSHTLLHLHVYYIYLMPHDIDVSFLFHVLYFVFFDWTMWYFLRHWYWAHLAKGNTSYCHHLVRSPSSSSVCCYCSILIFASETPLSIQLKIWRKYLF